MVIIPYFPVRDEHLRRIVHLKLGKIQRRIEATHGVRFSFDESLVTTVAARCTEVESGARNVDNILSNSLLPEVSLRILEQLAGGADIGAIHVGVTDDGAFRYAIDASASAAGAASRAGASSVPASLATLPSTLDGGESAPVL